VRSRDDAINIRWDVRDGRRTRSVGERGGKRNRARSERSEVGELFQKECASLNGKTSHGRMAVQKERRLRRSVGGGGWWKKGRLGWSWVEAETER
jgi:hypothetical protein